MDSTEREALYAVEVLVMNTLQPTNEILNGRETLKILHGIAKIAKYCHTHTHKYKPKIWKQPRNMTT